MSLGRLAMSILVASFLVRAVPGALAGQVGHGRDAKGMTAGVEGSQRLVKAYVSARWMAGIMTSWGEDMVRRSDSYAQ